MSSKIVVVYFSDYPHTQKVAEAGVPRAA